MCWKEGAISRFDESHFSQSLEVARSAAEQFDEFVFTTRLDLEADAVERRHVRSPVKDLKKLEYAKALRHSNPSNTCTGKSEGWLQSPPADYPVSGAILPGRGRRSISIGTPFRPAMKRAVNAVRG
jgi:hypothetical protein